MNVDELKGLLAAATPGPWSVIPREVMEDGSVFPCYIEGGSTALQVCLLESQGCAQIRHDSPGKWPELSEMSHANFALIVAMRNQLPDLLARLERAEKDAGRYRWLRDNLPHGTLGNCEVSDAASWDTAIDAALANAGAGRHDSSSQS